MPMGDDDLDSRLAHYARLALAQGTGEDVLAHTQGRAEQRGRLHLRLSLKHAYGIIILLLGVVSASWIWIFLQMQPSEPSRLLGGDGAASGVEGVQQGSAQESTAEAEAGANDMRGTPADDLAGSGQIVVYVSGQVARPGVYYLRQGQRIGEAIAQAGGLSENADDGAVNLAQRAEDGIHIHIPARGEASPNNVQDRERQNVNLNNASAEELQTLPGIGPHLAESIVQWRQKNGQFQEPHDVTKVPGIGESTFAKFADNVTV